MKMQRLSDGGRPSKEVEALVTAMNEWGIHAAVETVPELAQTDWRHISVPKRLHLAGAAFVAGWDARKKEGP